MVWNDQKKEEGKPTPLTLASRLAEAFPSRKVVRFLLYHLFWLSFSLFRRLEGKTKEL